MEGKRIAVVGAGIAGLVAAYELKKAGHDVLVFEKNEYPGGRMSTERIDGFVFDRGADFLVDGWYSLLGKYAQELGVAWQVSLEGSRPRVIRGGKPYYIDVVGPKVLFFNLLSFSARIRFLVFLLKTKFFLRKLNFLDLSSNPDTFDGISASEYLERYAHKEVLDYIGDPFTSIMQFHRADEISATALLALIQAMLSHPGGFRVAYTPGGMGMIPEALAKNVGVRYGVDVVSVASKGEQVEVVHGTGTELFDAVIVGSTGENAKKIIKTATPEMADLFSSVQYASTISLAFKIPTNLFADGAHLNYVPFVENQIISGYDNAIRKDIRAHKDGESVLVVYLHESAARALAAKTDDEVFQVVFRELKTVCPEIALRPEAVAPLSLKRWGAAMPKFTGALSSAVRAFEARGQGYGNIFLAGDYLNSPWTEGAARCGKRVAAILLEGWQSSRRL